MLRDYLDLKNRKQQNVEDKNNVCLWSSIVRLVKWWNEVRGRAYVTHKKSYKLLYNVTKLQGDSYNKLQGGINMYGVDTKCKEMHCSNNSG